MIYQALRTFLKPPIFPEDEGKNLRAQLLHYALLANLALMAFCVMAGLVGSRLPAPVIEAEIGFAVISLFLRRWLFQGRIALASGVMLALGFVLTTVVIARLGTIRVPATGFYMALIIATGFFFDWRGTLAMIGLSSLAVAGLIWAENSGLLPPPNYAVTVTQWLANTALFAAVGFWAYVSIRITNTALHRAEIEIAERKRHDTELARREARFRAIFDHAPVGISFTSDSGEAMLVNSEHVRITGVSAAESSVPGVFARASHPEDYARQKVAAERFHRGDVGHYSVEKRYFHADGRVQWAELTSRFYKDPVNGERWIVTILTDIALRKAAEAALRASEERYRLLVDAAPDAILLHQAGRIVFVNAAAVKLFGVNKPEEMMGLQVMDCVHPDFRQIVADRVRRAMETSTTLPPLEEIFLRADGTSFHAEVAGGSVMLDGKQAMQVIVRDITERKRLAADLAVRDARFRAVFDYAPVGISLTTGGGVIMVNAEHARITGVPVEASNTPGVFAAASHPEDYARQLAEAKKFIAGEVDHYTIEKRYVHPDGRVQWAELTSRHFIDLASGNRRVVTIITDIAQRKDAEARLQKIQSQLAHAMGQARIAYWEMDMATNTFIFNDSFYALYATTAEREGGYRMPTDVYAREFIPAEEQHIVPDNIAKLLSGEIGEWQQEHRIRRRNGELRNIVVRIAVVRDAIGKVVGTRGSNQDITERKRIEATLQESQAQLALAMDQARLAYWELDAAHIFTFNDRFYALYGTTAEKEGGYRMSQEVYDREFLLPEEQQGTPESFARLLSGEISEWQQEHRIRRRDGELRDVFVRFTVVRDEAGKVVGTRGSNQDITERKRIEADVLRKNQSLTLLHQLSHLLNKLTLPAEIPERLSELISRVFDNRNLYIALYDEATNTVSFPVYQINGKPRVPMLKRTMGNGLTEYVIRTGAPLLISDRQEEALAERGIALIGASSLCYLGVPMLLDGRAIGVVAVQDYERANIYDAGHVELLSTIAAAAAIALSNARHHEGLEKELAERRRMEEALRASELRFRHLLQDIQSVAVQGYNPDGTTQYWNQASERLYGYRAEEAIGRNLIDLIIPPEMKAEVRGAMHHMATTGQPIPASELLLQRKDGSRVAVFSSHAIVQVPGKLQELFCVDIDFTEFKRNEVLLKKSERALKAAQRVAKVGSWVWHIRENSLEWSDEMFHLFGLEKEGFSGDLSAVIAQAIHPDDRVAVDESNRKVIQEGSPAPLEYRIILPDNTVRIVWAEAGKLERDEHGRPATLSGIVQDITERKRQQEALRESDEKFRQMADNITDVFWITSPDFHTMHYVSPAYEQIWGRSVESLYVHPYEWANAIIPEERERVLAALAGLFGNESAVTVEYHITKPDGSVRYIADRAFQVRDAAGKLIRLTGIARDITERIKHEEKLHELLAQTKQDARTKGELLREVNHRVTNNLMAVLGLLAFEVEHAPTLSGELNPVIGRMSQRIRGLLHVHRQLAHSGWAPLEVVALAEQTIRNALSAATWRQSAKIAAAPSKFKVSPRQAATLAMVFNELATNTVKYAGRAERPVEVSFSTEGDEHWLTLSYRDNGPGYPAEVLENERSNVGLKLIRELVTGTLRGTVALFNEDGAVVVIRIRREEETRT